MMKHSTKSRLLSLLLACMMMVGNIEPVFAAAEKAASLNTETTAIETEDASSSEFREESIISQTIQKSLPTIE